MSDIEPFKHGDEGTHHVCHTRLKTEGGEAQCCECVPHDNCDLNKE